MKNYYLCWNRVWMAILLWLFTSCQDTQLWIDKNDKSLSPTVELSVEEAQAFFENDVMSRATTRNSGSKKQDLISFSRHQFPMGDIVPKWVDGEKSGIARFANVEVPMRTTYRYLAWRKEKGKWHYTKVYQKLLVLKEAKTNKMCSYIELFIPDKHFKNQHRNFNAGTLKNNNEMSGYSGLKIYTSPEGYLIRVNKYEDGKRVRGVFLGGITNEKEYLRQKEKALSMLKNIHISIKVSKASTRSQSEDEYDDDDWLVDGNGDVWYWNSDMEDWEWFGNIYDYEDDEDILGGDGSLGGGTGLDDSEEEDDYGDIGGNWLDEVIITGNAPDPDPYDPNDFYDDVINNTGNGGGSTGGNSGNTTNSSSPLTAPKVYFASPGDVLIEPEFPRRSPPQTTINRCVPAIISFLDRLLGGNLTEQNVVDYYNAKYAYDVQTKQYYFLDQYGIDNSVLRNVVENYFNCGNKTDYHVALDDCYYILTNVKVSTGLYHEVLIFGYDNDGNVLYLDPATGMEYRVGANYFFGGTDSHRVIIYVGGRK